MKIKIIAVGKLKDTYFQEACGEYQKRLTRFCALEMLELQDIKNPQLSSEALCLEVIEKEGDAILKKLENEYVVALCIEGKALSSEEFATMIEKTAIEKGKITFVIGGSLGLGEAVKKRADMLLSISRMTFPHAVARVLLLEQLYRGYKIIGNEKYHK